MNPPFSPAVIDDLIQAAYFLAALFFILGLKRMSSPKGARVGIVWAGVGMLVATLITFLYPGMHNFGLMLAGILIGGIAAWWSGKRVAMTAMPQMVALYNGMGGGAAAAIAAAELLHSGELAPAAAVLATAGALIGAVSFSGSLIAFAKLQGLINKSLRFKGQQALNMLVFLAALVMGVLIIIGHATGPLDVALFFLLALIFGVLMTVPIGGADMPVVISLYNAFTGLAVAFEGFVLQNPAMIIAGTVVGSAGTLLTQLMAKAMNRSISNVLFSNFGETSAAGGEVSGNLKPIDAADAGVMMAYGSKVIVVPGYGMAVAQAQHKVWELAQLLQSRGVTVKFEIGRAHV